MEPKVWELISGLLEDPETLEADLERMIKQERERLRLGPEEGAEIWVKRLEECAKQREKRLEQHAEGLISFNELRTKLNAVEETREVAERELRCLKDKREEIASLEKDKEALLGSYASMALKPWPPLRPKSATGSTAY